jgi:hypothetical protein
VVSVTPALAGVTASRRHLKGDEMLRSVAVWQASAAPDRQRSVIR